MRYFASIAIIAMMLILHSCGCKRSSDSPSQAAVYYWRTTLQLDSAERQFLSDNHIERIYMRYFDVDHAEAVRPVATIRFKDTIPADIEVVPVVYITQRAIQEMANYTPSYAQKLWQRVKAMSKSQGWQVSELQLDCDWSESTREAFFQLCEAVGKLAHAEDAKLSSTIRLHQLSQNAPPVDCGVLMVYNTGSFRAITAENSIFHPDDIKPYLNDNRLARYSLPLDVAWPTYGWGVAFDSNGKFQCLLHTSDLSNTQDLEPIGPNLFKAHGAHIDGHYLYGTIRLERAAFQDIKEIKKMVEKQLDNSHRNIIYHLDSQQLNNYKNEQIKDILVGD